MISTVTHLQGWLRHLTKPTILGRPSLPAPLFFAAVQVLLKGFLLLLLPVL